MHTKKRWKKILKKLTVMYIEKGLHEFTLIEKIIYIYIYIFLLKKQKSIIQ